MREIYVACAWCRWGIIKLDKEKMIQDIDDFVVTDENVWGGYVCDDCNPVKQSVWGG